MALLSEKEYFVKVLEGESGAFKRVIEATPIDKLDHTPHEKSRTAGSLLSQIVIQPEVMLSILNTGKPEFNAHMAEEKALTTEQMSEDFSKRMTDLANAVKLATDEVWQTPAVMEGSGMKWETTRGDMIWGFLFDMVHHRGQLSTYLRPMGGKVPMIYGQSGDSK